MSENHPLRKFFVIAGLVVMILAAAFAFGLGNVSDATDHGLAYSALCLFIASWV